MIIWEHAKQPHCKTEALGGQTIGGKHLYLFKSGYRMLQILGAYAFGLKVIN